MTLPEILSLTLPYATDRALNRRVKMRGGGGGGEPQWRIQDFCEGGARRGGPGQGEGAGGGCQVLHKASH